jgi:hypothetical protein
MVLPYLDRMPKNFSGKAKAAPINIWTAQAI